MAMGPRGGRLVQSTYSSLCHLVGSSSEGWSLWILCWYYITCQIFLTSTYISASISEKVSQQIIRATLFNLALMGKLEITKESQVFLILTPIIFRSIFYLYLQHTQTARESWGHFVMTPHGTSDFGDGGYICSIQSFLTVIFQVSGGAGIASEITHLYSKIPLRTQDLCNTAALEFLSLYGHVLIASRVWYSLLPTEFSHSRLLYFSSCTPPVLFSMTQIGYANSFSPKPQGLAWNILQCHKSGNQTNSHIMKSRGSTTSMFRSWTHYNPNNRFIDCIALLSFVIP